MKSALMIYALMCAERRVMGMSLALWSVSNRLWRLSNWVGRKARTMLPLIPMVLVVIAAGWCSVASMAVLASPILMAGAYAR